MVNTNSPHECALVGESDKAHKAYHGVPPDSPNSRARKCNPWASKHIVRAPKSSHRVRVPKIQLARDTLRRCRPNNQGSKYGVQRGAPYSAPARGCPVVVLEGRKRTD